MERNPINDQKLREALIDKLKEMEKSYQGKIPTDALPSEIAAELEEAVTVEVKSPGVYYIGLKKEGELLIFPEAYVVTANAPAISEKARTYGQEFPGHPDLLIYDINQPGSGRQIIDFEIRRYQIKCHLPGSEIGDSLFVAALYGAEEHPDYFGAFPVPFFTPRGCTVRHKTILNGVYWLETNRCEEMLAVCYPIWHSDISIPEQNLGEQLEYDRVQGINNTLGYLFFPKQSSSIPLYELSLYHPEIGKNGVVDIAALRNAICESYPEYAVIHNEELSKFEQESCIEKTPSAGVEFIKF